MRVQNFDMLQTIEFLIFLFNSFWKFEIRNPKYETNSKSECLNDQNNFTELIYFKMILFGSFEFLSFELVSYFVFRYSDLNMLVPIPPMIFS